MHLANPDNIFTNSFQPCTFLRQTADLGLPVADENPKVATTCYDLHPHSIEEVILPFHVPRGHNQDTLGRFREVAPWCSPRLQVQEVCEDSTEPPPSPCVTCIPWLGDARVCVLELSDEREDPVIMAKEFHWVTP